MAKKTTTPRTKKAAVNIKADADAILLAQEPAPKPSEELIEPNKDLLKLAADSGLNDEKTLALVNAFTPFINTAKEWKEKAEQLVVTSIDQKDEMKQARQGRLYLAKIRSGSENLRKKLKEASLIEGRTIDLIAKTIQGMIEPIEKHLENQEKFAEKLEQERVQKLAEERLALLTPYGITGDFYDLGNMNQEQFDLLLDGSKVAYERKLEAEKKAKEEAELAEKKVQLYNERKELLIPYWNFLKEGQNNIDFGEIPQESFDIILNEVKDAKAKFDAEQERIRKENEILKKREEEQALIEKQKQEELDKQILDIRGSQLLSMGYVFENNGYQHECGSFFLPSDMLYEHNEWLKQIALATKQITDHKAKQIAHQLAIDTSRAREQWLLTIGFTFDQNKELYVNTYGNQLSPSILWQSEEEWKQQVDVIQGLISAAIENQKNLAPDKEKIAIVIENLRNFELPQVTQPNAQQLIVDIQTLINKIINYATEKNNQL
jgi:hypothetical protein